MKHHFVRALPLCFLLLTAAHVQPAAAQTFCILGNAFGFPLVIPMTPETPWQCTGQLIDAGGPVTPPSPVAPPVAPPVTPPVTPPITPPATPPILPTDPGGGVIDPPAPPPVAGKRIAMSNGLVFPYTVTASQNNVRHYQKLRVVPTIGDATYSNLELTYANFVAINGGEVSNVQPVTVQAEVLYNGTYYPVSFNGQPTATINGGEHVTGAVAGLSLPSGAQFYERVRVVGAPGDQTYLTSHGARRSLLEGVLAGPDPNVNLLGGNEGHGATCAFNISEGRIASAVINAPGVNYTSAGIVVAWNPARTVDAAVGYAAPSNGRMSSIRVENGGSNYPADTKCVIVGGGGFGANAAIYAASLITGVPDVAGLKSILFVGDSITRGYGSTDSRGDAAANYGIFERAVGNRYATVSTALPGNTATAYADKSSHARMYAIVLPYVTHALISLGTNDIAGNGYSASTVANANISAALELRDAGIKVSFATLIPRVAGSYETTASQSPVNGFRRGGNSDLYNSWVLNGSNGLTSDWGVVDAHAAFEDPLEPDKWRVDSSPMTNDGIHPSLAVGIPFGASHLRSLFDVLP